MILPLLLLLVSIQGPQAPQAPPTIEEYLGLQYLTAVQAAPDGATVAFTATGAALEENEQRTKLYLWRAATGARSAAAGLKDVHAPRWSHDGAWLAFLSRGPDSEGQPQLWLLPALGGDPALQLSDLANGVLDYGWAPDGSIYALTVSTAGSGPEIWKLLVPGGTADYVWGGDAGIRELAVSPDGSAIVYSTNGTGAAGDQLDYDLRVLDLKTRDTRRLTSRPGPEIAPVWSPDSRSVAFQAPQDPSYPYSQNELLTVPATGGTPQVLTESFDRTVVEHRWPLGGALLFTAAVGMHTHLFAVRGNGAVETVTRGDHNFGAFDATAGPAIYAVRESGTEANELWRIAEGRVERLTDLNAHARDWTLGRREMIRWRAPDGLNIEGLLIYPVDYREGRRYPLLVHLGAGPAARIRDVLASPGDHQLFAAQGYAVLAPNARGSRGYGVDFATAARIDLAGGDIVDLMAGIDLVIEMGIADPERLAVYGSGYGAEMTAWTLTRTPRFGAAVAVFEGSSSPPSQLEPRGLQPALLVPDRSATANARRIRTPLLIVVGPDEFDTWIPHTQPRELYRALRDRGRPVEYIEAPSGDLVWGSPRQRTELFFRHLRWFDRYLKFGGADLFDFYLTGERVPGPNGWELRVDHAAPRADYTGMRPERGRYLELALTVRPAESAVRDRRVGSFTLDPATGLSLSGPDGTLRRLTGTVTDVLGKETLILGTPSPVSVPAPQGGAVTILNYRLAFEIPDQAGEYRLLVEGFRPVRIWIPEAR